MALNKKYINLAIQNNINSSIIMILKTISKKLINTKHFKIKNSYL